MSRCTILIHLFNLLTILFRSNIKEASDQVTETNPLVSLNREALFFMAILCGGDYDKVSLMPTVILSFHYLILTWGWTQRLWMENRSFTCPEWTCEIFIFSCINNLISDRVARFSSWLAPKTPNSSSAWSTKYTGAKVSIACEEHHRYFPISWHSFSICSAAYIMDDGSNSWHKILAPPTATSHENCNIMWEVFFLGVIRWYCFAL